MPPQRKTLLCLLRVMAPVLQTPRALAVRILLGLVLLRQMPLAVGHHLAHVIDVVLVVGLGVLVRVLLEDFDNLSPASFLHENPIVSGLFVCCGVLFHAHSYLSWPTVSPEPSSLLQPAPSDDSSLSQDSRSEAGMFTISLNSLA
jgi:hypothetical protein